MFFGTSSPSNSKIVCEGWRSYSCTGTGTIDLMIDSLHALFEEGAGGRCHKKYGYSV